MQDQWYQKLKDDGFIDIEATGRDIEDLRVRRKLATTIDGIECIANYYTIMIDALNDPMTEFRNDTDRYILQRYLEGAKIKTIVDELKQLNGPTSRHTIRVIIRRYEMRWNVRRYNRRQLNSYSKHRKSNLLDSSLQIDGASLFI